jgi:hypothetical protein
MKWQEAGEKCVLKISIFISYPLLFFVPVVFMEVSNHLHTPVVFLPVLIGYATG